MQLIYIISDFDIHKLNQIRAPAFAHQTLVCCIQRKTIPSEITMQTGWLKWCKKMITNSKLVVV